MTRLETASKELAERCARSPLDTLKSITTRLVKDTVGVAGLTADDVTAGLRVLDGQARHVPTFGTPCADSPPSSMTRT